MKTFGAGLAAALAANPQKIAICWCVRKNDGTFIRGTAHDRNIVIASSGYPGKNIEGTYTAQANIIGSDIRSAADLSVDNLEVSGAIGSSSDLTVAQIESGVLDMAITTVFVVAWSDPDGGIAVLRHGPLGEISRTAEGEYRTEVRGLAQFLQQMSGRTYGERCDAVLGDARCKVNLAAITRTGTVSSVTSRTVFAFTLSGGAPAAGDFDGGRITFTSGANNGFRRDVKTASYSAGTLTVTLYEETPADVAVSDTLSISPGCDKLDTTCRVRFSNFVNFRGWGLFMPGIQAMLKGGQ